MKALKKSNGRLALVLLCCFVLAALIAVLADGAGGEAEYQTEEYRILFSEICAKNDSILADNDGKYRDYVELYNAGEAVCLEDFSLTDGKESWQIPAGTVIGAGEYRVFFLGDSVTGFALGASGGDSIRLLDPQGQLVCQTTVEPMGSDQVMAYMQGHYTLTTEASPGYANTAEGVSLFREGFADPSPELVINEVLADNVSALPDENGVYSDVIELWNLSNEEIYLGNCYLSDRMDNRYQYRLPDRMLGAGEYLVVFCDGENRVADAGEIHANFSLSYGETLVLTTGNGGYTSLSVTSCKEDVSLLRNGDGSYEEGSISLGFENSLEGCTLFYQSRVNEDADLWISEVLLSQSQIPYNGTFCDVVEIVNRSDGAVSTAGWYLSDGGDPYAYPLPEQVLESGEYLVVVCSRQTTGFSLSEGETLQLTGPDFRFAPQVYCTAGESGSSIGLTQTESAVYSLMAVSLGYPNTEEGNTRFCESQLPNGLRISEVMSANQSYLVGPYSTTADWVELYNASDEPICLSDYCLSDDAGKLSKYSLPDDVLEPGAYRVLFLKSDDTNLLSGYDVLPFALSSQGDRLYLSRNEEVIDYVLIPELAADEAYGRATGSGVFSLLATPTPGTANSGGAEKCTMPTVSLPQGCYDGVTELEIQFQGDGDIYYTTDCTIPGKNAQRYTDPISITETTVFRVVCRRDGMVDSEVLDLTYVVNEEDNLPVVCLVTEPDNLWSIESGIYITGYHAQAEEPYYGANYWMDWERPATVSLFETDGTGFTSGCGIRIFGAFTRVLPKKSLAVFFRDVYGSSELAYPLFGEDSLDTYEAFVLRTSGQDSYRARLRDVVVTSLIGECTDVPVQDYKATVVYINGEYWGLHYIREKINENYVAGHDNVSADTVSIVKYGGWTDGEYRELVSYVAQHDMSQQEYYDYVCSQIDVDNYIDFIIAEIWIANTDNGNVKYYRNAEGKWTWFLYDTDLSLLSYDLNSVQQYLSKKSGFGAADTTCKTFAAAMMDNPEFQEKFLTRFAWQINHIWTEENLTARIDEIVAQIQPDMAKDCDRWGYSYASWEESVDTVYTFARKRNSYILSYIQNWFGLSDAQMAAYGFVTE